jgi:hypothetical protein
MSLTRSLIPQQHRPILNQLLVRLSLGQGQVGQEHGRTIPLAEVNVYMLPSRREPANDGDWDLAARGRTIYRCDK